MSLSNRRAGTIIWIVHLSLSSVALCIGPRLSADISVPSSGRDEGVDVLRQGFIEPVGSARARVLDAIPRGSWELETLIGDLRKMSDLGLGGAAHLDGYEGHGQVFGDITNFPEAERRSEEFMSPEHLRKLNCILEEAQTRGMQLVAPIRAMYFSGEPWIDQDHAQKEYTLSKSYVSGPGKVRIELPEPPARDGDGVEHALRRMYYRDALVVAWPVAEDPRNTVMHRLKPVVTVSNPDSHRDRGFLSEGDGLSTMALQGVCLLPHGPRPAVMPTATVIRYEFPEPMEVGTLFIKLAPDRPPTWCLRAS